MEGVTQVLDFRIKKELNSKNKKKRGKEKGQLNRDAYRKKIRDRKR